MISNKAKKNLLISFISCFCTLNSYAHTNEEVLDIVELSKTTGTCEIFELQLKYQIVSKNKSPGFVLDFWGEIAKKSGMTIEEYIEACKNFREVYSLIKETYKRKSE